MYVCVCVCVCVCVFLLSFRHFRPLQVAVQSLTQSYYIKTQTGTVGCVIYSFIFVHLTNRTVVTSSRVPENELHDELAIVLLSILKIVTSPFCPNTPVFWCPMKTLRVYSDLPLFHCGCVLLDNLPANKHVSSVA